MTVAFTEIPLFLAPGRAFMARSSRATIASGPHRLAGARAGDVRCWRPGTGTALQAYPITRAIRRLGSSAPLRRWSPVSKGANNRHRTWAIGVSDASHNGGDQDGSGSARRPPPDAHVWRRRQASADRGLASPTRWRRRRRARRRDQRRASRQDRATAAAGVHAHVPSPAHDRQIRRRLVNDSWTSRRWLAHGGDCHADSWRD